MKREYKDFTPNSALREIRGKLSRTAFAKKTNIGLSSIYKYEYFLQAPRADIVMAYIKYARKNNILKPNGEYYSCEDLIEESNNPKVNPKKKNKNK